MADLETNKLVWEQQYDWSEAGEEWSKSWGNSYWQWHRSIRPRLLGFLPAGCVLEIASGFGRWTQYLLKECQTFVGLDISKKCVDACQQRFIEQAHAIFRETDGKTLVDVADQSIDLVFSFDSLVHAESDVLESYVSEINRVLLPNAVAFIHHSNLADCDEYGDNIHYRAVSMGTAKMQEFATIYNLSIIYQEILPWGSDFLTDTITILQQPIDGQSQHHPPLVNTDFPKETALVQKLAHHFHNINN